MPAVRLTAKRVEKPWGRRALWPGFGDVAPGGDKVGEIWFELPDAAADDAPELLVKYLFTSEKLSVQVHPDDAAARARGRPRGKDEAWVILAAEPHAAIAIGTLDVMTKDELRAAALDGTIEERVDWKTVKPGDFFYSPAGTVHAIGPGLTLVEIQQNVDLTYRLYDYGSDRELHLDAGIAVADPVPYVAPHVAEAPAPGRVLLGAGPKLVVERWSRGGTGTVGGDGREVWLVPLAGGMAADGAALAPGGVWLARGATALTLAEGCDLLVAYSGTEAMADDWRV